MTPRCSKHLFFSFMISCHHLSKTHSRIVLYFCFSDVIVGGAFLPVSGEYFWYDSSHSTGKNFGAVFVVFTMMFLKFFL